ncbi:MAG: filamentous hemagglutinin N-terminal domain-containing protein [Tolypothrix carrinoi HA7290-LM1]|jgi:filamentous hemagglutinin family protein|nr:filamentous hemagglutinin N-terminal domain-containing protein [Tolypothrix carrinoi HA7290-LM1]
MSGFGITSWSALLGIAIVLCGNYANAQITPDGTLPNNSNISKIGNTFNITQGTQAGSNLFHSFQQFSVPTSGTAFFNNALDIQNIISRVTGGSISNIDGLIRANGAANLFLINPSGIVFGPNARLNVGGSILASTASSFNFADGTTFSATAPKSTPLLTISVPIGLQFGQNPANIQLQGSILQGAPNKTLGLVGGNLSLDNSILQIPGGRVELGSVGNSGTVGLNVNGSDLSLNFPNGIGKQDVSLSNRTNVNVLAGGGGSIAINARNLNISGAGTEIRAGIASELGSPQSKAGNIEINATEAIIDDGSLVSNAIQANAVGQGSDIIIKTGSLKVSNGARIETSSFGQGNAGNLLIDAQGQVSFINRALGFTTLEATGVGNGGNLQIQAGSVLVTNNSRLRASTLGLGNSGNVIINARDTAEFTDGAFVFSQVEAGGIGNGGETSITTGSLSVTNGAILTASTVGKGDAGRINIEARDTASFNRGGAAFTTVEADGIGNGNDLRIRARSLSVTDGSFLTANTLGRGNAGNVIIEAGDVLFDRGSATSSVGLQGFGVGEGNGGTISISTGSLQLANQAQLLVNSYGREGNAGNININARDTVSLSDQSFIFSQLGGGIRGAAGNIDISTGSLQVASGSVISTDTFGNGNGGNITIKARDAVSFLTEGGAYSLVQLGAIGNGGDINISTGSLNTADGSFLAASTLGSGNSGNVRITATDSISLEGVNRNKFPGGIYSEVAIGESGEGGNIDIKTRSLTVKNGARLATDTDGRGDAGSINIDATDFVTFDGIGSNQLISGAYSQVSPNGRGNANNINITTRNLSLSNGAILTAGTRGQGNAATININATDSVTISGTASSRSNTLVGESTAIPSDISGVFVQSESTGRAGDIIVTSPKINLDNQGRLIAKSESGNGGNINLQVGDLLLLRGGSQISTNAGTARQGGDGGNIIIDAPNGFIVAVPNENSDITANAFTGSGGRVNITVSGIYGIESRPRPTDLSDITASSELGVQGTIEINTPNVDPNRGLLQLTTGLVNTPRLVDSSCAAFDKNGSEFIVTGRGGLPLSPDDFLSSDVVWTDSRLSAATAQNQSRTPAAKLSIPKAVEIVPATGWVFNGKGEVTLISSASVANSLVSVPSCAK